MKNETNEKTEKEKHEEKLKEWMEDLGEEQLNKAKDYDILPRISVPDIDPDQDRGKSIALELQEDDPREVKLPEQKYEGKNYAMTVSLIADGVFYTLWLPKTLRFKLAVLALNHGGLKGLKVNVWKERGSTAKNPNSIIYNAQVIE